MAFGIAWFITNYSPRKNWITDNLAVIIALLSVTYLLAQYWMPLGASQSFFLNIIFVILLLILVLGGFSLLENYYTYILQWCLDHKKAFLSIPAFIIIFGATVWLGFNSVFGIISSGMNKLGWNINSTALWSDLSHTFPGMGKEFMPSLDEGSFLLMPTSMPHAGVAQNKLVVQQLDMLLSNIPEVELAVGKMGRVESAMDPAPISMYEIVINYKPEYMVNEKGHRERFKADRNGNFELAKVVSFQMKMRY